MLLEQLLPDLQADVGAALAGAGGGASACKALGLTNPNQVEAGGPLQGQGLRPWDIQSPW